MRLTVFALNCPPPELPESIRMDFGPAGGRIGRGSNCTLVLRDPNRHISREHAEIRWRAGEFGLKVVSKVNSVVVNDTSIGPGEGVTLADGDQIAVGDYLLGVELDITASVDEPAPGPSMANPFDLFADRWSAPKAEAQQDTSPDWFRQSGSAPGHSDEAKTEQAGFDALVRELPAASPLTDVLSADRAKAPLSQPPGELSPISDGVESFLRSLDGIGGGPAATDAVAHPELYRIGSLDAPFHAVV